MADAATVFPASLDGSALILPVARRPPVAHAQPLPPAGPREAHGGEASPSAGVIDSQGVTTIESGGPRGHVAGKKIKGHKRHIVTDTESNLVHALIHTADIQHQRRAAGAGAGADRHRFPWPHHLFAKPCNHLE